MGVGIGVPPRELVALQRLAQSQNGSVENMQSCPSGLPA